MDSMNILHRRKLLACAATFVSCPSLLGLTMANDIPDYPAGTGKHLDLDVAKAIATEFLWNKQKSDFSEGFGDDLDISEYSSASLEALQCLANLESGFAYIGVSSITPDMAKIFKGWKSYFLCFERIETLDFESAVQLGNPDADHALCFAQRMRIDAPTVEALCRNGSVIDMKLHNVPDLSLARALASHDHEMFLAFPSADISTAVANALCQHNGYLLHLRMPQRPSHSVLREFASNPNKHLNVHSPSMLNAGRGIHVHSSWLITLDQHLIP
jgi:hypothetical protein